VGRARRLPPLSSGLRFGIVPGMGADAAFSARSPGFPASGNFPASPAYDTTATPAAKQQAPPQTSPTEPEQQSSPASPGAAASPAGAAQPQQPAGSGFRTPRRASFVDVDDDGGGGGGGALPTQEAEVFRLCRGQDVSSCVIMCHRALSGAAAASVRTPPASSCSLCRFRHSLCPFFTLCPF